MIENPFAGRYVEDLSPLIAIGEELGELLAEQGGGGAWGSTAPSAHSYGKGGGGRREWRAGARGRDLCIRRWARRCASAWRKGAALIPVVEKRSGSGTPTLDIPLGHKDAAFVRSHFDGMEVQINDAPRANEIMVAVAVTDSGRPLPRVGGLTTAEVKGDDGLR